MTKTEQWLRKAYNIIRTEGKRHPHGPAVESRELHKALGTWFQLDPRDAARVFGQCLKADQKSEGAAIPRLIKVPYLVDAEERYLDPRSLGPRDYMTECSRNPWIVKHRDALSHEELELIEWHRVSGIEADLLALQRFRADQNLPQSSIDLSAAWLS